MDEGQLAEQDRSRSAQTNLSRNHKPRWRAAASQN